VTPDEIRDYLAHIRKTVAESRAVVEQARLRIRETDRLLERQGLTREQVRNFRLTRDQIQMANEELARRGLPPVECDDAAFDFGAAARELREADSPAGPPVEDELAERRRKFVNFMQEYRL